MSHSWLSSLRKDNTEKDVHEKMLTRTMTLVNHFSAARGNSACSLNLCDLFAVDVDCVGPKGGSGREDPDFSSRES